jgi:leukotriene A-4 hydrolase/aminopeptidase
VKIHLLFVIFFIAKLPAMSQTRDQHSFSKPHEVAVVHTHFDWEVDFAQKTIKGTATHTLKHRQAATSLWLDTKGLAIENIWLDNADKQAVSFNLGNPDPILGQSLEIPIKSSTTKVTIAYRTTEASDAIQWLEPQQTAGKKHPFLFTQGQAILSRTWFPCQDSPGVRFTWSAKVKVPKQLMAVMSAENNGLKNKTGVYHFSMQKPVPAYLVALSVGNLNYRAFDNRTGVYVEPEMLEKAAFEFAQTGKMVEVAERLFGSYHWGKYDLLVLPPSFPFGGMENPCLTFVTPTVIAGDRSLVSLIAHELAHSWSGNWVTNATWNDFWLNEGFTVYFERRIMEEIEGKSYADMLAVLGYQELLGAIDEFGLQNPATCLKLNLEGKDPDDGMNDIAYEKGYFLLRMIEERVGRTLFDKFLIQYFTDFGQKSLSTEQFLEYLQEHLLIPTDNESFFALVNEWVYRPGLPEDHIRPTSFRFQQVDQLASAFLTGKSISHEDTQNWSAHEWLHFLRQITNQIAVEQVGSLDQNFNLTKTGNNEMLFQWLSICLKTNYTPAYKRLEEFLINTGRRKFVSPLYKQMYANPLMKNTALVVFEKAKANYHAVTRETIAEWLKNN